MKSLIKAGLEEDAVVQGNRDSKLDEIVDEIERTLPKTEEEIEATEVEQADRDLEADAEVKYSRRDEEVSNLLYGFKEYDVISAVYAIRTEKAKRHQDLVKIGNMPPLYRTLFGLDGDVFVSNDHLYKCMVSIDTAIKEGRHTEGESADYHELPEEKIISAIKGFQDPIVIMESLKDYKEPRLVAILDEKGNDGKNLLAVMELYAEKTAYKSDRERNHVLITIYEKNSLPDYIENTVDKDRLLYMRKGLSTDTQADLRLVGGISETTLKKNIAQFNRKVKGFKEKTKFPTLSGNPATSPTENCLPMPS